MDITHQIEAVSDKESFLKMIRTLAKGYKDNTLKWENRTIDEYLESIASWVEDFSDCTLNDVDREFVDYRLILKLLYMGGIYE